jgi:CRP/FNR family transcriptional regulator, cyclic AMP receptor protein
MAMNSLDRGILNVFFLQGASPEAGEEFLRLTVSHNYPKGNILYHDGDPGTMLYMVVSGRVKICMVHEEGREVVLTTMNAGGVLGMVAALDDGSHIGTGVTLTDCRIACITRDRFAAFMNKYPALRKSIDFELASQLRAAYRKVGEQSLLPVKKRLLGALLEIARAEGSTERNDLVFLRPTQQELAERIGTTRVVVARAMKELLEEEAALAVDGRTFRLTTALIRPGEI